MRVFDVADRKRKGHLSQGTRLYPRERLFLQHLSTGKTPTEAALLSYNAKSRKVASQIASTVLKRPRFLALLERTGIDDGSLAQGLLEGLSAVKPVLTREGVQDFPDYQARLLYLKTILKIMGFDKQITTREQDGEPLVLKAILFKKG